MGQLEALSLGRKLCIGAALVLLISLFLSWQKACASFGGASVCGTRSGWHGIGILVGLLALAVLVFEAILIFGSMPALPAPESLIAAVLAILAAIFAVLEFLTHNEARAWPAWLGLICALVLGYGAWLRFSDGPATATRMRPPPVRR